MRRLQVLIVDDDAGNRFLIRHRLEARGYAVSEAVDGNEAIHHCITRGQACDVVIMDLAMPVMDGVEATRVLRAYPSTRELPILIVSAHLDQAARARAAGADAFLAKPYKGETLWAAIDEALAARA